MQSAAADGAENLRDEPGWMIQQKHIMNGRQRLLITPTKLRVDNLELGYSLIADSKLSTISAFNSKRGLRFSMPIEKFRWRLAKAFLYANAEAPEVSMWKKVESVKIQNTLADCFRCSEETTYFKGSKVGGGFLAGAKRKATITYSLFVTKEIPIAPVLMRVIDELEGVPQFSGVPLFMKSFYGDTRTNRIPFETTEIRRQKFKSSIWTVPNQYKTAKDISEITSGDMGFLQDLVNE